MADEKDQRCIFSPVQKDLSVNPLLDVKIGSLDFVPHLLCLYWSLNDFCTYRYSLLTSNDKAAIESLKGSSACDAAWAACHMGQQTLGLSMIENATDGFSFILKSIFTWTKPMTPAEKPKFEPNGPDDEICQLYAKCACTNQEKTEEMLKTALKSVKVLFSFFFVVFLSFFLFLVLYFLKNVFIFVYFFAFFFFFCYSCSCCCWLNNKLN